MEEKLSERKKEILYNAVEDYIQSASPITSGAVHKNHLKNTSPATLRNELSTLEAMGYLKQLHTSGGRIPTTKAYRLFVNELMHHTKFDKKSLGTVREIFSRRTSYLTDIVNEIAGVISEATNYPAFVVLNNYRNLIVENIKIIPLIDGSGIVLIGTNGGIVNNTIKLQRGITEENCIDASNFLTNHFKSKTIHQMAENLPKYLSEMSSELKDFTNIFNNLIDCLENLTSSKGGVIKAGTTKLLNNPEYSDLSRAKKVLSFLENEQEIKQAFHGKEDEKGVYFSIGKENAQEELEDCSVIKANYNVNGNTVASIGVIGPERMDYGKAASALKFIVEELDKLNYLTKSDDFNSDKDKK